MHEFNLSLGLGGALLLFMGLTAGLTKNRWHVSEPTLAMLAGVVAGPHALDVLGIGEWEASAVLEEAARFTLAIALIEVAMRLPSRYLSNGWRPLAALIGVVMPAMWLVSSAVAYLALGASLWVALLIGAVLAPTDPVVASSIVTGRLAERSIPARLRHAISAESGANDALVLPLVMLPILMLKHPPGAALQDWAARVLLWEVGFGALVGALAGWSTGKALLWFQSRPSSERTSLLTVSLALAMALMGGVKLVGSDGLLAAFVAGLFLNRSIRGDLAGQKQDLHEAVKRFFDLPVFVLLGMALPLAGWAALGWGAVALVAGVLLLRRLPALLVLRSLLRPIERPRDVLFVGWFGPIGIAALYYARMAQRVTGEELVWVATSLVIAASVLAHGTTATGFTRLYGAQTGADADASEPDALPQTAGRASANQTARAPGPGISAVTSRGDT